MRALPFCFGAIGPAEAWRREVVLMARIFGPTLTTARLTLRPVAADDGERMASLLNDYDIARMVSRIPHPYTRGDAEDYLAHVASTDLAREVLFVLETRDDGLCGVVGLDPSHDNATELGYWLGRPFWGSGFMTEAVCAVLDWVRHEWGRRYLVAGHFADNPRSARVLTKSGFLYTGETLRRHSLARGEDVPIRMMVWLA